MKTLFLRVLLIANSKIVRVTTTYLHERLYFFDEVSQIS